MNKGLKKLQKFLNGYDGSQADFGREIGVGRDTVCHILRGRRNPTMTQAAAIEIATDGKVAMIDWVDLRGSAS